MKTSKKTRVPRYNIEDDLRNEFIDVLEDNFLDEVAQSELEDEDE
jgi:hypothetical protein